MKQKSKKITHKSRLFAIKIAVVLAGVLLLIAPAGSTTPQVKMYSMVTCMGIDKGEDGVKFTAEVILPSEGNGAKGESIVISSEGSTLSSAIESLSISLGRTLDISHCALCVVGREKAEDGVLPELNYLLSAGSVSPEMNVVLAGNKNAEEFLQLLGKYGEKLDIDNLIKYLDYGAHNFSQTLLLFLSETNSESQTSVMPCLKMGDKAENQNAIEANADSSLRQRKSDENSENDTSSGEKSNESNATNGSKNGEGNKSKAGSNVENGSSEKYEGGGDNAGDSGGESSKSSEESSAAGDGESEGSASGDEKQKNTIVQSTEKIGIFKDGRLADTWGAAESKAIALRDLKTKNGHIILHDIRVGDSVIDKISCYLVKKKVNTSFKLKKGVPTLCYKINAQFLVEEKYKIYEAAGEISQAMPRDFYSAIENEIKQTISGYLHSALDKSRCSDLDPLLVKDHFYKFRNKDYKSFVSGGTNILESCALDIRFNIKVN